MKGNLGQTDPVGTHKIKRKEHGEEKGKKKNIVREVNKKRFQRILLVYILISHHYIAP